ncbi:MAG TPA: penicillin-binding protein 1C [Steroidobacter sp.]|jgi:penicillin-binding protein 1C|nr:penicillin-binding protein 1C [Steroidobacteraceae bacterium]HLS81731.1 penicillin-binding protein 1C [Steroidobacter sp.]
MSSAHEGKTASHKRKLCAAALVAILLTVAAAAQLSGESTPFSMRIPTSTAVFDRNGRLLRLTLASDQQYRIWTPLEKTTPLFVEALLLHEDRHFYRHPGVNPISLVRAAASTYAGGPRVGGSTITMQLARLLYGLDTRSIPGKLKQIALALQLELQYTKRELLEAHINLAPYGGAIQGVGAASLIYFNKPAAQLDLAEALTLVLIPQSPAVRAPRDGAEPAALTRARARLLERWASARPTAQAMPNDAAAPLRYGSIRNLPFAAPHFSDHVLRLAREMDRTGAASELRTMLDLRQQRLLERVLENYVRERRRVGVQNAAALLVDYRDMSVRAMIGSADFHSAAIHGQVNGTRAKRSPGSALKPFVYALAIDQGLIHPLTVLKDAPTSFGPFSPENFDGRFAGPVTATAALIRSRNVPAVTLASQLAQPSFHQFLQTAGVSRMHSEKHYGLALVLGGGEVTMEETAMLYAMLANRGRLAPLLYFQDGARQARDQPRLLSEEASFMTLDMLRSAPRPADSIVRPRSSTQVAWKTGTSWGFRDAWTAGVFGPYVLVVWVGNFDGRGNPEFVGLHAAAPLFFRLVDALTASERIVEPVFRPPPRLQRIEVCSASGDLPNAECPHTTSVWYIPGVSPIKVSDIHRRVWIDARSGLQACPPFDPAHTRSAVFEFWPTDLLQLFAQAGMPRRRPPPASDCQRDAPIGTPPHITSPISSMTYTVRAGRIGAETIPLVANADSEVRRLHWFVNETYVGVGAPGAALAWTPERAGRYLVRAVDDRGRADSRALRVELVR